jgi:hypothetical protein
MMVKIVDTPHVTMSSARSSQSGCVDRVVTVGVSVVVVAPLVAFRRREAFSIEGGTNSWNYINKLAPPAGPGNLLGGQMRGFAAPRLCLHRQLRTSQISVATTILMTYH